MLKKFLEPWWKFASIISRWPNVTWCSIVNKLNRIKSFNRLFKIILNTCWVLKAISGSISETLSLRIQLLFCVMHHGILIDTFMVRLYFCCWGNQHYFCIIFGCCCWVAELSLQAELITIRVSLDSDCIAALSFIENNDPYCNWRYRTEVQFFHSVLNSYTMMDLAFYLWELNYLANILADHSRRNPRLSLFHQGIERPRWLEEVVVEAGLIFWVWLFIFSFFFSKFV